jgi:hypothetical protein
MCVEKDESERSPGTATTNLNDIKSEAITPDADSNVVPFGTRKAGSATKTRDSRQNPALSVVTKRRAAIGLGAGFGLFVLPRMFHTEEGSSKAVERMRARRKSMQAAEEAPAASDEEFSVGEAMEGVLEGVGKAGEAVVSGAAAVSHAATGTYEMAVTVAHGAAVVAGGAYKVGQTVASGATAALDVAVPAAKLTADKLAPVVQETSDKMMPILHQAMDKADPVIHRLMDQAEPTVRSATEAFAKVANDPQLSQARANLDEATKAVNPYIPVLAKFLGSLVHIIVGALSWCAALINTWALEGGDGAKQELVDTLRHQAGSLAQVTKDVAIPVTKEVVLPALRHAGEVGADALRGATDQALNTPSGQALSQAVSEADSQKEEIVKGLRQGVEIQSGRLLEQVAGSVGPVTEKMSSTIIELESRKDGLVHGLLQGVEVQKGQVIESVGGVVREAQVQTGQALGKATDALDQVKLPEIDAGSFVGNVKSQASAIVDQAKDRSK